MDQCYASLSIPFPIPTFWFPKVFLLTAIVAAVVLGSLQDKMFQDTLTQKGVEIRGFATLGVRRQLWTTIWHTLLNVGIFIPALFLNLVPPYHLVVGRAGVWLSLHSWGNTCVDLQLL